jgi:hypothetical protein
MLEDVGNVLTWALCGGVLIAVILVWLYVFARLAWGSIRKRRISS